jgi:adenylate kinase family enzyme
VQRIHVIGSSGSGKTTVARELARRLKLPHFELDALFHGPNWSQADRETFHARIRDRISEERWVTDGNYVSYGAAPLVWTRADTIVWLDLPRARIMSQLIPRTLRRIFTREELWNGNRERLQNLFETRPEENVILWSWTRFERTRARYAQMLQDGTWAGHRVFRLRSRAELNAFLAEHAPEPAVARD